MDNDKKNNKIKASPAARRIARELGLDLHEIAQDVQGRVQIKDVELYHQKMLSAQETVEAEIDQIDQEIQEEALAQEEIQALEETAETFDPDDVDAFLDTSGKQPETNVTQAYKKIPEDLPEQTRAEESNDTASIEEVLAKEETQTPVETAATLEPDTVTDTDIQPETNFTLVEGTQENLPEQTQDEVQSDTVLTGEELQSDPVQAEQNHITETVEPESELPIMIKQPQEIVMIAETNEPKPIDEPVIQDVDEIDDPIDDDEDDELFIPPIPISISFEVSDLPIRNMISGLDIPLKEGLINAVVKACCSTFVKAEISLYESRVNLVKIKEKNLLVQTASNFEDHKISELKYTEAQEDDDILINIWDMTDYEFNSVQKADVDSVNLFILWDNDKITVDLTCDEFIMEIGECTYYMHMLKKYLDNPILMLL